MCIYIRTVHSQVDTGTGGAHIVVCTAVVLCSIFWCQAADHQDGLDIHFPTLSLNHLVLINGGLGIVA